MSSAIRGMRRMALLLTAVASVLLAAGAAAAAWVPSWVGLAMTAAAVSLALFVAVAAAGGWIATSRQARLESGAPDLYLQNNATRSEQAVLQRQTPRWSATRRWLAANVFGHRHLVGDAVRIRSLAQIRATLDAQGCVDGLPFMDEMAAFCNQGAFVYRIVDKIYDYGRSRQMRQLDNCVLLVGLRCDGAAHAGCQAACYLIWNAQWLEAASAPCSPRAAAPPMTSAMQAAPAPGVHSCQYTQLTAASRPMHEWSWRRLWGPCVVGNVSARAFCVALLTRLFNGLQQRRSGLCYPWQPAGGNNKSQPATPFRAGDWVRVRSVGEIARTLDKNSKNKGLWFDRDMLKHSGSVYQVRGRIDKIVDIHSGAMIPMKTACIALEDVHYSGEFQGFGEQHDYLYWREAWLEPAAPDTTATP